VKLAEALAQRSDSIQRLASLRERIETNAQYQEGVPPLEDANELIAEATSLITDLTKLICRINVTNTTARLESGETITEAIALRDTLRMQASLLNAAAKAASGSNDLWRRRLSSELRMLTDLDVRQLHLRADSISAQLRDLDLRIQQANWNFDLEE